MSSVGPTHSSPALSVQLDATAAIAIVDVRGNLSATIVQRPPASCLAPAQMQPPLSSATPSGRTNCVDPHRTVPPHARPVGRAAASGRLACPQPDPPPRTRTAGAPPTFVAISPREERAFLCRQHDLSHPRLRPTANDVDSFHPSDGLIKRYNLSSRLAGVASEFASPV